MTLRGPATAVPAWHHGLLGEWEQLPNESKFQRLAPSRQRLIDTVKLIAYRPETALTAIVCETLAREDDARSLVRDLFNQDEEVPRLKNEAPGQTDCLMHTGDSAADDEDRCGLCRRSTGE
jgi:hypothetical protein